MCWNYNTNKQYNNSNANIQKKSFNNIDNNMYYEFSKDINPIYNINVFYDNNIAYYNNPNSNFNDNQKYNINSYNDSKDLSYSNS